MSEQTFMHAHKQTHIVTQVALPALLGTPIPPATAVRWCPLWPVCQAECAAHHHTKPPDTARHTWHKQVKLLHKKKKKVIKTKCLPFGAWQLLTFEILNRDVFREKNKTRMAMNERKFSSEKRWALAVNMVQNQRIMRKWAACMTP